MAVRELGHTIKWRSGQSVRVRPTEILSNEQTVVVRKTLLELSKLSGLDLHISDGAAPQAEEITLTLSPDELRPGLGRFIYAEGLTKNYWSKQDGLIRRAEITIRREIVEARIWQFTRIFQHEMLHALGLTDHAHGFDSISSYRPQLDNYSEWDKLFVQLLYSARLNWRLGRAETLASACEFMIKILNTEARRSTTYDNHILCEIQAQEIIQQTEFRR